MDKDNEDVSNAARKAAKRFQRRRERDRPSTALIAKLKQSREAAGLPLNAVNPAEERNSLPSDGTHDNGRHDESNAITIEPEWDESPWNKEFWQDNKTVTECNLHMLNYEIGCDVRLLVGESREVVNAHSYVLSSRSTKFANTLGDQKMLDSKLVAIPDVKPEIFKVLLWYIYTDNVELTVDSANALIPASSVYGPASLKADCFSFLLSKMNFDNVCRTMELAHIFSQADVYKRCLKFIYVNAVAVLRTSGFKQLCDNCIEEIVKSDDLNADEFNVFEGLVMWANGECSRRRIQPDDPNRRQVLDKVLFHVRFAVMDVLDFTQKISHNEILSQEEKIILYQYFHGETNKLPPHYNTTRRHGYKTVHNLVPKANKKDHTPITFPNMPSPKRYSSIPHKHDGVLDSNHSFQKVLRFKGLNKNWKMRGPDAIGFQVSKPVILHGAQVFGSFSAKESYDVEIIIHDACKEVIRREKKTIVTEKYQEAYDVILSNPVRVPEGRTFIVQTSMRGKPTYHGTCGLEVVEMDGVTFQFFNSNRSLNGTDVTIGQIPSILFSKI